MSQEFIMPTYFNQTPLTFARGAGAWLWDSEGNAYLDGLTGISVCNLGHCHPSITEVMCRQAATLVHTSNNYWVEYQQQLSKALCAISGMEQVYFGNSGAEANEAAFKMTRAYARKKGIALPLIITLKNSFHGRSMGTLSISGTPRIQEGFEPFGENAIYVEMNDISALKQAVSEHQARLVAIMLEPIQGDGGIRIATNEYLQTIRVLCDEHDLLMIVDEIQCGMGRTGKWFAHQWANVVPDVMTLAKALGNGLPVGACLARGKACNLFGPGKHGCTFGGGPFISATCLAVVETIEKEQLLARAEVLGAYIVEKLAQRLAHLPIVTEIRSKGLMIGIVLDRNCFGIMPLVMKHKVLFNVVANQIVRLLPALTMTDEEADELIERVALCIEEFQLQP